MKLLQTVKRRMGTDSEKKKTNEKKKEEAAAKSKEKGQPADSGGTPPTMVSLPMLRDTPPAERPELFRKKMQVCRIICDFTNDGQQREKEMKRVTLLEIVEYANNTRNCFSENVMQDVVSTVGVNIFRALNQKDRAPVGYFDPEEEEPNLEKAWPHLQIVYEFFLRFVVANDVDPKVAKHYVDQNFVLKLLELFDSEDPRERDYLKTILHRVYGKFMVLRSFIRRAIQHMFFKVIYESEYHNGVGELLEILGSIINGFALPLKEEHKDFLLKALIPLCKVRTLHSFHQQLFYCMMQYAEKDPRLTYEMVTSMLRFWPVMVASKQVLFQTELEEMLELTQMTEFCRMQEQIAYRFAACITSPHFQVAERALLFWNNDYIVQLINQNREVLYPIIIAALYTNTKQHWNSAVHGLTFNVLKLLMEADSTLFDECSAKHRSQVEVETEREATRQSRWKQLRALHDNRRPSASL